MSLSRAVRFILAFGMIVVLCNGGKVTLPKPMFEDFFAGEILELKCLHKTPYKKEEKVSWKYSSYGRSSSFTRYYTPTDNYVRVEVEHLPSASVLRVFPTMVNDSGRFDCIKNTGSCSWKINIHDTVKMVYVITSRGQKPWEDTVVSDYRVILVWSAWSECDGCAGNGERRKFGFCYVVWQNKRAHCSDTKGMPILMRTIAKRRREEIIVDICFDHCTEYEKPLEVEEQRIDVRNGANVVLTCVEKASVVSAIRWERGNEVLKRSDVSFGFSQTQSIYIAKNNDLQLHNIDVPRGGVISLSCVQDRQRRSRFDLYVAARPDIDEATFKDHLFWIGISSTVQTVAFILLLFLHITIENMVEVFKKQITQLDVDDDEDDNNDDEDDDNDEDDDDNDEEEN